MQRKSLVSSVLLSALVAFALAGSGCKKEEPKPQNQAAAPAAQPAAMPAPAAAGIFGAQITVDSPPQGMKAGQTVTLAVKVKNTSSEKWTRDKATPINLSYHWRNEADKKAVVWDGKRTMISKDVAPGEEIALSPKITAPNAGKYVLELDMVMDAPNGGWFGKKGSQVTSIPVAVD